jgi:DNA-binding response OmpR family regulator
VRILLVEDEKNLAEALCVLLKRSNFTVDHVSDGESGLYNALSGVYDVIVLDIMLPKMSGIQVLKRLREEDKTTAVIMLTARGDVADKISGLNHGADDYLPKPFNTDELIARINAVSRRKSKEIVERTEICFDDITLDMQSLMLTSPTAQIQLTLKEAQLLEYLIQNNTLVLSKEKIIDKIWGYDSDAADNNVEVYISFLRKKLKHLKSQANILTIRGLGYKLMGAPEKAGLFGEEEQPRNE